MFMQTRRSCIIIELKESGRKEVFVQCKKYNSEETPLPEVRRRNQHRNWNLGTALYACHTFLFKRDDIDPRSFAKDLVRYMVGKGPSDEAIKNSIDTVPNLMKWSKQLDINMKVVSNGS